jgi:hypothetical protein
MVYDRRPQVRDLIIEISVRQVRDLPRTPMAEPHPNLTQLPAQALQLKLRCYLIGLLPTVTNRASVA